MRLAILLGLLCIGASNYDCQVLKVHDGDTIKCQVETWPGDFKVVGIRVYGIDTAEKNYPLGKAIKEYAVNTIKVGSHVKLSDVANDKYAGRALASVEVVGIGDWSEHLISKGYAKPYFGESKVGLWKLCELELIPCQ